jgi:hypothetical protein
MERIEDLPKPRIELRSRSYRRRACHRCGRSASRDRVFQRTLHDLGKADGRPKDIHLTTSQHHCIPCGIYFLADTEDLAARRSLYTKAVVELAVRLVIEDGLPYRTASWHLWRDHRVFVPFATVQNWVEAAGEKRCRARSA